MLKKFNFFDNFDDTITSVTASSFDFAYLIFCSCFGFYEVVSVSETEPNVYFVEITNL